MAELKTKYYQVVNALRGQVVRGVYRPGDRLPNRSDLSKSFGVGMATVQKALDSLMEDGFVHARAGMGTFVADRPPHLSAYALAFPEMSAWSRFYGAVREAAKLVSQERAVHFREYLTSWEVGARGEVAQLCRAISNQRLAGTILSGVQEQMAGSPLLERDGAPRVLISDWPGVDLPAVTMDVTAFTRRSVEYLHAKGRRRIAHLALDFPTLEQEKFVRVVQAAGAEVRPYWLQSVPLQSLYRSAANITHLLMELDGDKRPDGLIIHDDNLVDHAVAGIIAAGAKVPHDLEIVALCNYPLIVPSVLPTKQLGLDCRILIRTCLDLLDMQRRGEKPPLHTMLMPLFDDEAGASAGAVTGSAARYTGHQ